MQAARVCGCGPPTCHLGVGPPSRHCSHGLQCACMHSRMARSREDVWARTQEPVQERKKSLQLEGVTPHRTLAPPLLHSGDFLRLRNGAAVAAIGGLHFYGWHFTEKKTLRRTVHFSSDPCRISYHISLGAAFISRFIISIIMTPVSAGKLGKYRKYYRDNLAQGKRGRVGREPGGRERLSRTRRLGGG